MKQPVTIALPKALLQRIDELALMEHRNRSEFIAHKLEQYLSACAVQRRSTAKAKVSRAQSFKIYAEHHR